MNPEQIYLDAHASTPVRREVLAAMNRHWEFGFANPHSVDHFGGWMASRALAGAGEQLGGLLGRDPDEVIFTSGATEANNLAILGAAEHFLVGRGAKLVVSAIEHPSVLEVARYLSRTRGTPLAIAPVDSEGRVDREALRDLSRDGSVGMISVMAVNNEIGTIQDLDFIAGLAAEVGSLFHCDASQAPAAGVTTAAAIADLVTLSGHKAYGPKGIGALLTRRHISEHLRPIIHGGGQQGGLRSGTVPVPLCVGLAAAIEHCHTEKDELKSVAYRRDLFVAEIQRHRPDATIVGPRVEYRHPANATIRFPGTDAHQLLAKVQPSVQASHGSACHGGGEEPSHVLTAIGLSTRECRETVRFGLLRDTTADSLVNAADLIARAVF